MKYFNRKLFAGLGALTLFLTACAAPSLPGKPLVKAEGGTYLMTDFMVNFDPLTPRKLVIKFSLAYGTGVCGALGVTRSDLGIKENILSLGEVEKGVLTGHYVIAEYLPVNPDYRVQSYPAMVFADGSHIVYSDALQVEKTITASCRDGGSKEK